MTDVVWITSSISRFLFEEHVISVLSWTANSVRGQIHLKGANPSTDFAVHCLSLLWVGRTLDAEFVGGAWPHARTCRILIVNDAAIYNDSTLLFDAELV